MATNDKIATIKFYEMPDQTHGKMFKIAVSPSNAEEIVKEFGPSLLFAIEKDLDGQIKQIELALKRKGWSCNVP